MVAWEFCYQIIGITATFYPGIWRITSGNTDYTLVQSNIVTYNQSVRDPQDPHNVGCQIFSLSDTDQLLHQQDQLWDYILMLEHCYYILTLTVQ